MNLLVLAIIINKEGEKRNVKKLFQNKKREVTLLLVSIMVLVLFFSGCSMGKQYSSTRIEANSKIAKPILIVEDNSMIEITGKEEKEYYNFAVKNYRETGEITQISLTYDIEILFKKEEAISFKLYKNNQEISLQNNKTVRMEMKKEIKQKDDYQLVIIYDKSKNDSSNDIVQDIQIKVHSEQEKV